MSKSTFGKHFRKGPDYNGKTTYIMYHGTTMKAAKKIKREGFIRSEDGMLGPGVYVSRSFKKAACYPKRAKGKERAVLRLSVCVGRVKKIDRQGHHLQKSWHQAGYNTAWVPPKCGMVKSGLQENCVWDPKRIRVLSILREISDDESTDANDDSSTDEDDDDSSDSSDSSDTSTDEYGNTDDSASDPNDDTSSGHSDEDEASDEGGSCDESSDVLTETDSSESSTESSDEDS